MKIPTYAVVKNGILIDFTTNPNPEESSGELVCLDDVDNDRIPLVIGSSYINGKFIPSEDKLKQIMEDERNRSLFNLREERNKKLFESDVIMIRHLENGEPIPQELKDYRQILRDLPQNITDTENIDWPSYNN